MPCCLPLTLTATNNKASSNEAVNIHLIHIVHQSDEVSISYRRYTYSAIIYCPSLTECVSGCIPSPGVCVGSPAPPLAGALGPLWLCRGLTMRCARESVRRVPLGAVRQVPGPQGGGRTGVRVGERKQRWSALCPHWLIEMGKAHPFTPLPMGAISHFIFANQKNIQ